MTAARPNSSRGIALRPGQAAMKRQHHLFLVTFLTFLRIPLVLLFFAGAIVHSVLGDRLPWLFPVSLALLVASAATDAIDGYLARKFNVVSTFGAYADPLTDKVFYLTSLPVLVYLAAKGNDIPHAIALLCFTILFLLRDQWVSFLRSLGARYGAAPNASWSGKLRTAINFPLVCLVYYFLVSPAPVIGKTAIYCLEGVGLTANMITIWEYTRRYLPHLRRAMTLDEP